MSKIIYLCIAAFLFAIFSNPADCQTYKILHHFSNDSLDGDFPCGTLTGDDSVLYGTTSQGGRFDGGTIFKINTDGTGYQTIYHFGSDDTSCLYPSGSLVKSGNLLFGTTSLGGQYQGTIYCINTDGTGFRILHSYMNKNHSYIYYSYIIPYGELIESGQYLYGTVNYEDMCDSGSVFRIKKDGSGFTKLHSFKGLDDGKEPYGGLLKIDSTLYGIVSVGAGGCGAIYKVNIDGSGFSIVRPFEFTTEPCDFKYSNLIKSDSSIYGDLRGGGINKSGVIFRVNPDGSNYKILFDGLKRNKSEYGGLFGTLVNSGNYLYGYFFLGNRKDSGAVYRIQKDGSDFKILHTFIGGAYDGAFPPVMNHSMIIRNGCLYGLTTIGGKNSRGVIFALNDIFCASPDTCSNESLSFTGFANDGEIQINQKAKFVDSHIRLVPKISAGVGSAFYYKPVDISGGFSTVFKFRFSDGYNDFNDGSPSGADGLAFIVQAENPTVSGSYGGGIGFSGILNSLAVEFDNYNNNDLGDPDGSHAAVFSNGLLANSSDHRSKACLAASSNIPMLRADSNAYYAKIEYIQSEKKLSVWIDTTDNFHKPAIELQPIDLQQLIHMINGDKAYIGFTASTGTSFQNTDIINWDLCPKTSAKTTDAAEDYSVNEKDVMLYSLPPYPEPASDLVKSRIYWQKIYDIDNAEINIYNIFGHKVNKSRISVEKDEAYSGTLSWNCSDIETGIYFIRISLEGETLTVPFVVAR